MNWFAQHRQEWIYETLRVFGFIQRQHLMLKFGISMLQASADLQRYQQNHLTHMVYDKRSKRYLFTISRISLKP